MIRTTPAEVAVIVTSYRHQAYVEQCLDSIAAQTRAPERVIVVDDHSPDDSAAVIRHWLDAHAADYDFIEHRDNRGLNRSLNEALALVTTSHYFHISADDWLDPQRVERQLEGVEAAAPEVGFLASDFREVGPGGTTLAVHDISARLEGLTGEEGREELFLSLLEANSIPAPAVIVRTEAARSVGGYDESLSFEDYDLWLKLVQRYPAAYAPGIASCYRVLGDSMTRSAERIHDFRQTERDTLAKHRGHSTEADAIIARRVAAIDEAEQAELRLAAGEAPVVPIGEPRRHALFRRRSAKARSAG